MKFEASVRPPERMSVLPSVGPSARAPASASVRPSARRKPQMIHEKRREVVVFTPTFVQRFIAQKSNCTPQLTTPYPKPHHNSLSGSSLNKSCFLKQNQD